MTSRLPSPTAARVSVSCAPRTPLAATSVHAFIPEGDPQLNLPERGQPRTGTLRDIPATSAGDIDTHSAQARRYRDSGHDGGAGRLRPFNDFHLAAANVAKGRRHAATEGATDVPDHNDGDLSSRGLADLARGAPRFLWPSERTT